MPSLLPGYEYDIFISYRQKDNKYGGWVTEFVSNLKKELEATFKEDISIYFDENPHDGLLETHLVEKSLGGKLKCLVFIPVISQTYCDPKSFAWQHEFCAFNRLVTQDGHGRDIRVSNGNVASRILPIKIHDLDAEDQRTLESEIGGPLRAVEFIYKEPGVNRPLLPTDVRSENLTKTDYRNQVNKVANMVRELISSIRNPKAQGQNGAAHDKAEVSKRRKPKLVYTIALIVVFALSFLAYYVYKPTPDPQRRPRIAVLPFKQISETGETYFADGIKQVLVQHLQANEKLEVPPSLVATDRFRVTTMTYREIAAELSADYLIDVSVKKWGDSIRLVTRLIDPIKDELRWQQDIKIVYARFFEIQEGMAASISESLGLTLSAPAQKKIQRVPTHSTEAYDYYLRAEDIVRQVFPGAKATDSLRNKVKMLLRLSIQADSNFVEPYPALAGTYFSKKPNDSLDWLLDKALSIDPTNPDALNLKAQSLFFHRQDTAGSMKLALRNIEENPYNTQPILWIGWLHHYWFKDDRELLGLQYYLQAYNVDPRAENIHEVLSNIGIFLFHFGDYARGETYLKRAIELQPKDFRTFDYLSNLYSRSGEYEKLLPLVKRMEVNFPNQVGVADIAIANLYLGDFEDGLAICKEYLKSGSENDIAAIYGSLLERTGDREKARKVWQSKLKSLLEQGSSDHWRFARYYSKLGQNEEALTHIEQIQFTHTDMWANPDYLLNDYMLEPLRSEPRFIQKMKKEQDRLANVRSRLARMEQEKILVLPRLLPNP